VLLVRDGTFAALSPSGGITGRRGTAPDGLFRCDARHLSRWRLTMDGAEPSVLSPAADGAVPAVSVLMPRGVRDEPAAYTVFREQAVASGVLLERLRLVGNRPVGTTVRLELVADADFADQFELRSDGREYDKGDGRRSVEVLPDGAEFGYRRGEDWSASTTVRGTPAPDSVRDTGEGVLLGWTLTLPPHGEAELTVRAEARTPGGRAVSEVASPARAAAELAADIEEFALPWVVEGTDRLARACAQGLADLALLRVPATGPDGEELRVPGAGIPWFLTLFGRDSLLTSLFALPYRPALAEHTLLALAATQGTGYDVLRNEQPGRIVHEVRSGELAHFRQVPFGRYYGAVDSTPLFLVLLHAHRELAARLERHARAAVDWMLGDGGLTEHGWLVYTPDPNGLVTQNWKDSAGAICFADGTEATGPVAVAEVQGYAYDALVRTAELAREVWDDPDYAHRLESVAADLRARFHRDFWLPEQDFPALALDGEGRRADALASDAGHLLWSGILDAERAARVGRRLLEPDFFSGWAVRTLASGQAPYHPLSYHRGSCWPHDNAVIALGLARHGLTEELRTLADGLLAAAEQHGWRLPEVMAGYSTTDHPAPVPYPHSCSPQAWAAATPLALLTALRGGH